MKVLARLLVFYFVFSVTGYVHGNSLQRVNLQLQFVTDMEQPNWNVRNNFDNFPKIYGKRGELRGSWNRFVRKFIKKHILSEEFGVVDFRQISLESQSQISKGNYLVSVSIDIDIEKRALFEYFINQEYVSYQSEPPNKGHVFYASHQMDNSAVFAELPTLKGEKIDLSVYNKIPAKRLKMYMSVLNKAIKSEEVKDPETQSVKELSGLAVNYSLMRVFESILRVRDVSGKRRQLEQWMNDAIVFRVNALDGELLRLPDKRVGSVARYLRLPGKLPVDAKRIVLFQLYIKQLERLQTEWVDRISKIVTNDGINDLVAAIKSSIEKQDDSKFLKVRQIASFPIRNIARKIIQREIEKAHTTEINEHDIEHVYTSYRYDSKKNDKSLLEMSQCELLEYYAPDIVQIQQINQLRYNPAMDQFGKLMMIRNHEKKEQIFVDVCKPIVYTHTRDVRFDKNRYLQLTYEFWYPEHPKMFKGDKEAGRLDGRFLTITLDDSNLPVIYETAMNCGCFYEVYITGRINEEVFQQLSSNSMPVKYKGKPISGILQAGSDNKVGIMITAGFHTVVKLYSVEDEKKLPGFKTRSYQLKTVESLELLPFEGGYASIYQNNGLVKNGGRLESYLLWMGYPENYYAGWNRHQSQRRYDLDSDKNGFHNPFWIKSVLFGEKSSISFSNAIANERIEFNRS
ncbi:MAG: hypothetical protein ACUZ8E_00660 [Candidatus Anammoxibacter sp.]